MMNADSLTVLKCF